MNSGNSKSKAEEQIDREAAEWFIKKDRGLSEEESIAFEAWINRGPLQKVRYQRHKETWERFAPLEEFSDFKEDDPAVNEDPVVKLAWYRRHILMVSSLAAALVMSLMVWGVLALMNSGKSVEYEERFVVDNYENRILADGSIVELKEDARVKVTFTGLARDVWLHKGEAHFHVAKDLKRPFVVHAGNTKVRAVGTVFNVRLEPELVQVIVTEGRVSLSQSSFDRDRENSGGAVYSQEMDAGQVFTGALREGVDGPTIETFTYDQLSDLLAWKPETLEFTSTPLGDVVMAFNKRNKIQIILKDAELETMPVEATFRSDNVLAFARLLELTFDLDAERKSQDEIILSQPL